MANVCNLFFTCIFIPITVATYLQSQPSVFSGTKQHALYLTLRISSTADAREVAKVAANLQSHVNHVSPPEDVNEETEIVAGVGFGENFYAKVAIHPRNFTYRTRIGEHGILPATDGDIFFHAKSDSISKLFELTQEILRKLPDQSVTYFEDQYGFVYRNGRDLSGFIDGTENPQLPERRKRVAVEKTTGASFALTQQWIHNMTLIEKTADPQLEEMIGRTRNNSIELKPLPPSSHVARMVGSTDPDFVKKFEIVRQSQPIGGLSSGCGLFFIAYAKSTDNHNFMLDNMVGLGDTSHNDHVMLMSRAVSGNFWYFPGENELKELA